LCLFTLEPSPFTPLLSLKAYFQQNRQSESLISPGTNPIHHLFDIRGPRRAKPDAICCFLQGYGPFIWYPFVTNVVIAFASFQLGARVAQISQTLRLTCQGRSVPFQQAVVGSRDHFGSDPKPDRSSNGRSRRSRPPASRAAGEESTPRPKARRRGL